MARPRSQPPRPDATPPESSAPAEQTPSVLGALGVAAAAGALAPGAAVPGEVPLAVGTTTALTASAVADAVLKIIAAFIAFATRRRRDGGIYLRNTITFNYPERSPQEIDALVRGEMRREIEFLRKQKARLRERLPAALKIADPEQRRQAVAAVLSRERDYLRMREEAMATRALNAVERMNVKDMSPQGAYWKLSDAVMEHTLDCLMMGNKFWPWKVLDVYHPQLHHGCACSLVTLDEAVQRGWMLPDQVPDVNDAVARAKRIMDEFQHVHESLDAEDVLGYVLALQEAPIIPLAVAVGRQARYARGTAKGGQFRPKRGGNPGAPSIRRNALRKLSRVLPEVPKSPAQHATDKSGRWTWMEGRRVFVPEYRAFEREFAGRQFYSPPGSTNVYRDGHLVDTPHGGPTHPAMKKGYERAAIFSTPPIDSVMPAITDAHASQRREDDRKARDAVEIALMSMSDKVPPVTVGASGRATHEALLGAGFNAVRGEQMGPEAHVEYVHGATGSFLSTRYDLNGGEGMVGRGTWNPQEPKVNLDYPLLTEPPKSPQEFLQDTEAFIGHLSREHGTTPFLTGIEINPDRSNHNGIHGWDGVIELGKEIGPSIERVAAKRMKGETLTHADLRDTYDSLQTAIHEALHSVFPIGQSAFQGHDEHRALEEALTEELAHHYTVRRLRETGQQDVIAWRQANLDHMRVLGSYQPFRVALDKIMNEAKIAPEDRTEFLLGIKKETNADARIKALAQSLSLGHSAGAPEAMDNEKAADRVRSLLRRSAKQNDQGADVFLDAPLTMPETSDVAVPASPAMLHNEPLFPGSKVTIMALPESWQAADTGSRRMLAQQGAPVREHDGEIVNVRPGGAGEHNFVATVRLDDGRTVYNVLDKEFVRVRESGLPPEQKVTIGNDEIGKGDLIHYNGIFGGVISEAVVDRVEVSRDGVWVIHARTNENSQRPNTPVVLTAERVGDVIGKGGRLEGEHRDTGETLPLGYPAENEDFTADPVGIPSFANSAIPVFTGMAQQSTVRSRHEHGVALAEVRPAWIDKAIEIRGEPGQGVSSSRWTTTEFDRREGKASEVKAGDKVLFDDPFKHVQRSVWANEVEHKPGQPVHLVVNKSDRSRDVILGPNSPVTIETPRRGTQDALRIMAERNGFQSVSQYEKATDLHLRKLTDGAQVAVRVRSEALPYLLQEGRLRNAHHGHAVDPKPGEGHSDSYVDSRGEFERKVWSIPDDAHPDDYPVYGYLTTPNENIVEGAVGGFGDVRVTLKQHVRDRSTFNYSDSFYVTGAGKHPYIAPSALVQPDALAVSHFQDVLGIEALVHERGAQPNPLPPLTPAEEAERARATFGPESWDSTREQRLEDSGAYRRWKHGDFFEAHVHGGVNFAEDVESVVFPNEDTATAAVTEHLNELGVPWAVYPDAPRLRVPSATFQGREAVQVPDPRIRQGMERSFARIPDASTWTPRSDNDQENIKALAQSLGLLGPEEGLVLPGRVWIQRGPDDGSGVVEWVTRSPGGVRHSYDVESAAALALIDWRQFRNVEFATVKVPTGRTIERFGGIFDGFEHDGFKTELLDAVEIAPGKFHVEGLIRVNGVMVGSFERTTEGNYVTHESLHLEPEHRGAGFAAAFNRHAEDEYRRMVFRAIKLATVDVGGYAWARAGWEFDPELYGVLAGDGSKAGFEGARRMLDYFGESFVREAATAHSVPKEVVDEFVSRFPTTDEVQSLSAVELKALGKFGSEFEIAGFGREHSWVDGSEQKMWLGKLVMVGQAWTGVKRLGARRRPRR
jgi:hypothetical protein